MYKLIAYVGIAWVLLINPVLYFFEERDQHHRKVAGMANLSQQVFAQKHATNGVFVVPEVYGMVYAYRTQDLLVSEEYRSAVYPAVVMISSGFILTLSFWGLGRLKPTSKTAPAANSTPLAPTSQSQSASTN